MKCKICGQKAYEFSNARILRKYDVRYWYCSKCGFLLTDEPYWLEEAYSFPLTSFGYREYDKKYAKCQNF